MHTFKASGDPVGRGPQYLTRIGFYRYITDPSNPVILQSGLNVHVHPVCNLPIRNHSFYANCA